MQNVPKAKTYLTLPKTEQQPNDNFQLSTAATQAHN